MSNIPTARIRNVALVGHGGVGKTTLAEALLHRAGATQRLGSIAEGSTTLDREPEEIRRGSSVSLGVGSFTWKASDGQEYRINLLDTPGHPDFVAEVDAALHAADLALVVVSAVDGIEVGTEEAWRRCEERGLPRLVFVTGEDRARADFQHTLAALSDRFGSGITPIELPLGEQEAFHGLADVLAEEAHEYGSDGGHHVEPLPADIADHEHEVHEQVVEEIVSGDDAELERYLEGETPTPADLERTLASEVVEGTEFPVLVGSGLTGVGVDRLADYLCEIGPSPALRPVTALAGDREIEITPDPAGEPLVTIFKTVSDRYVGQVSIFKVLTGTLRPDTVLRNTASGDEERIHALFHLCGGEQLLADQLVAGDIGAATKLGAAIGTTLTPADKPVVVPAAPVPAAQLSVALVPASRRDEDKLAEALQRLRQEDPSLVVGWDALSRRATLAAVGDAHLAVALSRLEDRYGVAVTTEPVRIAYRRTIGEPVEVEGRIKKQTGGHGQFAAVTLRVSPLERGTGFEFVDSIVGGAIPKTYVAAVRAGLEEAMGTGAGSGIPVVDIRVEAIDGKTHPVDSSDMAFRTAAATGLGQALELGGSVLLEPVSKVVALSPVDQQGDVLGDLSARRGRIVANTSNGDGEQEIAAEVPTAELEGYAMSLRAMTAGRGSFSADHLCYDVLPDNLVAAVLDQYAG